MNAQILLEFAIEDKAQGRLAASILDGTSYEFSGELCFHQNMNFDQAAELFGGNLVYPEDIKNHKFNKDWHVNAKADLWYKLSDKSFGVTVGYVQTWREKYGVGDFAVAGIKGNLRYTGEQDDQYIFGLKGEFSLGMFKAGAELLLGTEKDTVLILTAFYNKNNTNDISLPNFISAVSNSEMYDNLEVPSDFARPQAAFNLNAVLNLTRQTFLLTGEYKAKSGGKASAVLYFSKNEQDKYVWLVGLQMINFNLADISCALKSADRFLGLEDAAAAVILSGADQEIHKTEDIACIGEIGRVKKGLTFRVSLSLHDGFLEEVVDIEKCSISGHIPTDKEEAITLSGRSKRIKFLQFLTLTDITVELTKGKGKEVFSFFAKGKIQWNFAELNLPEIEAGITVKEDSEGSEVTLDVGVGKVEEPLGIPATTLEELLFHASSKKSSDGKKSEEIYFKGKTKIADLSLEASIYFKEKSPTVVELAVGENQELSISSLVWQYLQYMWPEILDIKLYNGRIWYSLQTVTLEGTEYKEGFYARVCTQILFLPKLELTFSITFKDEKRMNTTARFAEPVELAFLKLYNEKDDMEYGPDLSIDTMQGTTTFGLKTHVSLFSFKMGLLDIHAKKDGMVFTYTFPEGLPISGEVTFNLDKDGVSFQNCSIQNLNELNLKISKLNIKSKGGECYIELIPPPEIKTIPEVKANNISLKEMLKMSYDFTLRLRSESVLGDSDIVELTSPNMKLEMDPKLYREFSFETLVECIGDNIEGLAVGVWENIISGEIFKNIFTKEGMKNFIKFLTIEGTAWVVNQLVSYLICEGLEEVLADSLVAAMTSAAATEWSELGYALALGGIVCIVVAGIVTIGKRIQQEDNPTQKPETPNTPTVRFQDEDEELIIQWNDCEGAEGYSPIVFRESTESGERTELVLGGCQETNYTLHGRDEKDICDASYGYMYFIKILAWNRYGTVVGGEKTIYLPERPTGVEIRYFCETKRLRLRWNKVDRVSGYEVEKLWREQGEDKKEKVTYPPDVTEAFYDNREPGGSITIKLRGKTEDVSGPAAGPDTLYLYDLQAPSGIQAYDTDDGIVVEWNRVPYAYRYHVTCQDDQGKYLSIPECREPKAEIAAAYLHENVVYTISIRPMTEEIEGRRSEEVKVLWRLPPVPEIIELICGEDGLLVFVLMIDGIKSRQIVYPDGRAVILDEQQLSCEWDIGENARVRVSERARRGKWSDEISVRPLMKPQNMQLSLRGDTLCVTWEDTGENCAYGIEIFAENYHRVVELTEKTSWETDIAELSESEIIRVCLYAVDRSDTRRHSAAVEESLDRRAKIR